MSDAVEARVRRILRARRARELAWLALLAGLPLAGLVLALARAFEAVIALVFAALALPALGFWAWRRARRYDRRWLARRLDAAWPALEDSAALVLLPRTDETGLAAWQRRRIAARLAAKPWPEFCEARPRWPWLPALAGLLLPALWAGWPAPEPAKLLQTPSPVVAPAPFRLLAAELQLRPPAYLGLPETRLSGLDVRVPEGSRVRWRLAFSGTARAVRLRFLDGRVLELANAGEAWQAEATMDEAGLYRLELDGADWRERELHRLELIPDRAPELRIAAPDKSLTAMTAGQVRWEIAAESSDDHGLGAAELRLVLAQGTGENISFSERRIPLAGEGDALRQHYRHSLDLAALKLAPGDDLVLRLAVADRREPAAQWTVSPAYILRWPPEASAESAGMEGQLRQAMPAYFRSQRQLIIDTQALLDQRPRLAEAELAARSDALGVEQKLLRLRYGQFLGEEFESGGMKGAADADPSESEHEEHEEHEAAPAGFGEAGNVLAEFGHTHDQAEAATLLDPETKALLKSALAEMWQSELQLRLAQPALALPYENKALRYIKQVQQATRIYLARVGLELPPVDEARRLSGERPALPARADLVQPAQPDDPRLGQAWTALQAGRAPDFAGLQACLQERQATSEQSLAALAALDALRESPGCGECRQRLAAALWPWLEQPAARVSGRAGDDALGRAYLDALESRP
ncbi:MAG: hypothetical protein HYV16_03865 [Gammaproteobacteria bacterium]|nr:hypothetical protein [Gammaproteobacteria bacterium]